MNTCPKCNDNIWIKSGHRKEKQRYKCKNCGYETVNLNKEEETKYIENKDSAYIESKKIIPVQELLELFKVDTTVWEVERYIINKWDTTSFDNKESTTVPNFQVKVWLKKKQEIVQKEDIKKDIKEIVSDIKWIKNESYPIFKYNSDRHLLEINLFDLHFGKIGWRGEAEDYDIKIAKERFENAFEDLIAKASKFGIRRILFPIGNDFFNSDCNIPWARTTMGTPQEDDTRWKKVFVEGRKMLISAINKCACIAPTDIVIVSGNHEEQKIHYLGDLLEAVYDSHPNVTVDNSGKPRKYYKYGQNLIGFTHGNSKCETENRLLQLMPVEVPDLWAKTKYREWHLGDIHHKKVIKLKTEEDYQGLVLRYMRSLTADDEWHSKKGYVNQVKGGEAYLFHEENGLIANFNYNL